MLKNEVKRVEPPTTQLSPVPAHTRTHTQPVFAKAGRPNVGGNISRKPWEIHPDKHCNNINTLVLIGPSVAKLSAAERGGHKWPIWYTAEADRPFSVPAEENECMRAMSDAGLLVSLQLDEIQAVRDYVRSIPVVLKGRTRTHFWVTPLIKIDRVDFDLLDLTRAKGLTCPPSRNCNWRWLKQENTTG